MMVEFGTILQFIQATGIIVGVAYYIMNIQNNQRNQELTLKAQELSVKTQQHNLETRQAQLFMTIYQQIISESFQTNYIYLTQGGPKNYEEFKEMLMDPDKHSFAQVITFFEGVGVLVREGLLDIRLITLTFATQLKRLWEIHSQYIVQARVDYNMPRLADQTEYLYNRLVDYVKEHPELRA